MYNNENVANYSSLEKIIDGVEEEKIMLPEFQRKFTWSIDQTVVLFDSLARGIFIGPLIIAQPSFDLTCREIDRNPRKGPGSRRQRIEKHYTALDFERKAINVLLDGQQRVTSMYRALKGHDIIYFVLKGNDDLPTDNLEIRTFEEIIDEFSSEIIPNRLCLPMPELYKSAVEDWREKKIEKEVLEKAIVECNLQIEDENQRERYLDITLRVRTLLSKLISDKTLLSVFLLDMDLEKFCMFFERSNSKGVSLNFIDIITAKIYVGFKLKQKCEEAEEKYGVKLDETTQECFVRYISFIKTGKVDRKSILLSVDHQDFIENWDHICKLYSKTVKFITNEKLLVGLKWLPYTSMLIPMMHFLSKLPSQEFSQRTTIQDKMLKVWFWESLLNNRYGGGTAGSTNIIIAGDCEMLSLLASDKIIDKSFLSKNKFEFSYEEMLDITSRGVKFNCIMSIIHYNNGMRGWISGGSINLEEQIDIHHIFPVKYVENKFGIESSENENIDSILNKCLLEKITNIKFKDKAPSVYLKKALESNESLVIAMNTQLIPNPEKVISGEYDIHFEDFLQERYELFGQNVKRTLDDLHDELMELV